MMNWGGKKAVYTVFIYEYMNKPSQCFYNTDLKTWCQRWVTEQEMQERLHLCM